MVNSYSAGKVKLSLLLILLALIVAADPGFYSEESPFSCGEQCSGGYELNGYDTEHCENNPVDCFNTIDDCRDGTYTTLEHVENITITDLNDTEFYGGHTIEVDAYLDCDSDGDEVTFVYHNGSEWKPFHNLDCNNPGITHHFKNLTLDEVEGNHTVRVTMAYAGDTDMICAYEIDTIYSDTDDVTFFVKLETTDLVNPRVWALRPEQGQRYNYTEDLMVNITVNASDDISLSSVAANISWGTKSALYDMTNISSKEFRLNFTNTSYLTRYDVNIIAYDDYGNKNDSISTYFIINATTNLTISYPVEEGLYRSGQASVEFEAGSNLDVYNSWVYVIDGENHSAHNQWIGFNDTTSETFVNNSVLGNLSQSFFMSVERYTSKAAIYAKKQGSPADVRIEIWNSSQGVPDAVLAYGNLTDAEASVSFSWINITLNETVQLEQGKSYWIYMNGSGSASDQFQWKSNTDQYTLGNFSEDSSSDVLFIIYDRYRFNVSIPVTSDTMSYKAYANANLGPVESEIRTAFYDYDEPSIYDYSISPESEFLLDPQVLINVTANISENLEISTVKLYYKLANESNWHNDTMRNPVSDHYVSNLTVTANNNVTIIINATDTSGNKDNLALGAYAVRYETNWSISPETYNTTGVKPSKNVTLSNLTVVSDADFSYTFNLSSVAERTVYFNGSTNYTFGLDPGQNKTFTVKAAGAALPSEDAVSIIVKNLNTSDTKENNFTLVTYISGPYLTTEIVQYSSTVAQGSHIPVIKAKIWNVGNETATNLNALWQLPSGWTSRYDLNNTYASLEAGGLAYKEFEINADLAAAAATGAQQIIFTVNCSENSTSTVTRYVTVTSSGSSGSQQDNDNTGSSSTPSVVSAPVPVLIKEDDFSIVQDSIRVPRGIPAAAEFTILNNESGKSYTDIGLEITGLFSSFYELNPAEISQFDADAEKTIVLELNLPEYYAEGSTTLNLAMTLEDSTVVNKGIEIIVFDPYLDIEDCLNSSIRTIRKINETGFNTQSLYEQYLESLQNFQNNDYAEARKFCSNIEIFKSEYDLQLDNIRTIAESVDSLKEQGYDVEEIHSYLAFLNETFFQGNLDKSSEFISQAELYLESARQLNKPLRLRLRDFFRDNLSAILILVISIPIAGLFGSRIVYVAKTENRLKALAEEKEKILLLMETAQEDYFNKKLLTHDLYEAYVQDYSKRLGHIEVVIVRLKNRNLFHDSNDLPRQKQQVEELLKKAHEDYYSLRIIDQKSFEMIESFYNKVLSEIDENIEQRSPGKAEGPAAAETKTVIEEEAEDKQEAVVNPEEAGSEPQKEVGTGQPKEDAISQQGRQAAEPEQNKQTVEYKTTPDVPQNTPTAAAKQTIPKTDVGPHTEPPKQQVPEKYYARARSGSEFILANKVRLFSIKELHQFLRFMNEELFRKHVAEGRNDFSDWIRDVFEETSLALELFKTKNIEDFRKALDDYKDGK